MTINGKRVMILDSYIKMPVLLTLVCSILMITGYVVHAFASPPRNRKIFINDNSETYSV